MIPESNAELHARPSIYFSEPALVEHFALMPRAEAMPEAFGPRTSDHIDGSVRYKVERHTEFVTVTRVVPMDGQPDEWPRTEFDKVAAERIVGMGECKLIANVAILAIGAIPDDYSGVLARFGLGVSAGSYVGGKGARIFSDFQAHADVSNRILLLNDQLNAYRLGRMVRRLYEIETYRAMALLSLPEARALAPSLSEYDLNLIALSERNTSVENDGHRGLLDDISRLCAHIVSTAARTRHRFGATTAYAKIVEERIAELREEHVPGFQRFGIFIHRRFKPAVRTCEATAVRLDQLSQAAMLLIDLLQTRIQVEAQLNNNRQMKLMAERTAVQLKIQRAVEGFSVIAITYYLVALSKSVTEALSHSGLDLDPRISLAVIPVCLCAVALTVLRVKKALSE